MVEPKGFGATLYNDKVAVGGEVANYSGNPKYVPHAGNLVVLNIDTDTGKILNWDSATRESISDIDVPKSCGKIAL